MKPLIKIETVPISIEMKTQNARIERKAQTAELEIRRDFRGLSIKSRPIKLNVDTFQARNSVLPTPATSVFNSAQDGRIAASEATARIAEEGQMLLNIHLDQDALGQIAANRMESNVDFGLGFLPQVGPDIQWQEGDISIQYEMDRLNFEWSLGKDDFKFTPGDIEVTIKEYNKVIIEYIGDPIYVPPSADPNYVPVDTKA